MSMNDAGSHFDQAKAEAFAGNLLTALNHGALCLMVSVGRRTGLFDIMSKARRDEVSREIPQKYTA